MQLLVGIDIWADLNIFTTGKPWIRLNRHESEVEEEIDFGLEDLENISLNSEFDW